MLLGAGGGAPAARPHVVAPVSERAPTAIVHDYVAALAALRRPKATSFDYTVSQLGLRNMEQKHHVYRSGLDERDETLFVDGYALRAPSVRIVRHRSYRYDAVTVAPKPAQYAFTFVGANKSAAGVSYRFRTLPRSVRAFEVVELEIDGRSALPSLVRFRIAGSGARGQGTLRYGRSGTQWVVREARVTARLRDGKTARERIVWSNYRFYDSLPKSTFDTRKSEPKPRPSALPPVR